MSRLAEYCTADDKIAASYGNRLHLIVKTAELFEVTLNQAIGARRSYLWKEFDYYMNTDCNAVAWDIIYKPALIKILEELHQLKMDLYYRSKPRSSDTEITDDMISRAKMVPVTDLIDFANGRSTAWCHDDSRPSLYVVNKINKVVCPSCGNKKFDSIDILVQRDGLTFREAVLKLCQR
jgi:hypothetical protein